MEIKLSNFICPSQLSAMRAACHSEEGDYFKNIMIDLSRKIATMPQTHQTADQGDQALAILHYFNSSSDWWITERDQENDQLQAFGFACLNGNKEFAELGYISITELIHNGVELNLYWTPIPLSAIKTKLSKNPTLQNRRYTHETLHHPGKISIA